MHHVIMVWRRFCAVNLGAVFLMHVFCRVAGVFRCWIDAGRVCVCVCGGGGGTTIHGTMHYVIEGAGCYGTVAVAQSDR